MEYEGQFPNSMRKIKEEDQRERHTQGSAKRARKGLEQIKEEALYTDPSTRSHDRDHRNQHTHGQSHRKTHHEELPQQSPRHLEDNTWTRRPLPTA